MFETNKGTQNGPTKLTHWFEHFFLEKTCADGRWSSASRKKKFWLKKKKVDDTNGWWPPRDRPMRFVSNNLIVPEGWPPLWDRPEPVPLFFFFPGENVSNEAEMCTTKVSRWDHQQSGQPTTGSTLFPSFQPPKWRRQPCWNVNSRPSGRAIFIWSSFRVSTKLVPVQAKVQHAAHHQIY